MQSIAIALSLVCVFVLAAPANSQTLLGDVDNAVPDTLVLSPNGKRFAIVTVDPHSNARQVIVDGQRMGKQYDSIAAGTPIFSADGQHVAFVARTGRRCYVVRDGVESDGYLLAPDGWPISSLVFGGGGHLAFKARVDGRTMVAVDREHFGPYEVRLDWDGNRLWGVWDFCFSNDGAHFAYRARVGDKMALCIGKTTPDTKGKEPRLAVSTPYNSIGSGTPIPLTALAPAAFAFIAVDKVGEHVAIWNGKEIRQGDDYDAIIRGSLRVPPHKPRGVDYIAQKAGKWHAVIDGKEGPPFDKINPFMYTAAGRCAYAASRGDSIYIVVDGVEGNAFDGVRFPGTVFSPDGKRVAYAASVPGAARAILDSEAGPRFDFIDGASMTFSPDSTHLAYVAQQAGKHFVVIDGKPGPKFDLVSAPRYNADGSRFAYRVQNGLDHFLIIDDVQFGPFAGLSADSPLFSADGERLAYAALTDGQWRVTVDDKAEPPCEGIVSRLTFTKQGLAYVGKFLERDRETMAVVANGRRGKLYDAVWLGEGGRLLLDDYFGKLGPLIYRNTVQWE